MRVVLLLASTVVLARILSPEDFGVMAIVLSIVAFGELFRDFGLTTASAREQYLSEGQKTNLFWTNTGLGLALAVFCFFLAGPVSVIFHLESLRDAVQWISLVLLLNGMAAQFRAELNRQLRFLALSVVDTVPAAFGLIAALLWAWLVEPDYSVLVVQQLAVAISGLIAAFIAAGLRPGLPKRDESIRSLFRFSAGLFGTQGIAFFTKNIDNLSLGYFWGTAPLGLYSRAYQLLMMPLNQIAAPMTRVMVPILSRVQANEKTFNRYLIKSQTIGGVGLCSLYGLCVGLALPIVGIVFGPNWLGMTPIFQILAIGGIFRVLSQMTFWIFLAKGQSGAQFRFYLISQPVIVVLILAGLPWGVGGVAIGHTLGYALNWIWALWWCGRKTHTVVSPLLRSGIYNIIFFAVPAGVIGAVGTQLVENDYMRIVVAAFGFLIYLVVSRYLSRHVRESISVLASAVNRART